MSNGRTLADLFTKALAELADLFTKALAEPKFIYFRDKVMYRPPEVTVANTDEVQDKEQTMKVLDTISMEEVD